MYPISSTTWRRLVRRVGPLTTIWVGAILQSSGYLLLYAAASGRITVPYWAMLAMAACACNGQVWYETASLVTCTRNFETERCARALNKAPCTLEG